MIISENFLFPLLSLMEPFKLNTFYVYDSITLLLFSLNLFQCLTLAERLRAVRLVYLISRDKCK